MELGETNEETLIRKFKEEINANIIVDSLQRVGEIFFSWPSGNKPCHQICLYYKIELADDKCIPLEGEFWGIEQLEGGSFKLEFSWVDINNISDIELYPVDAKRLIAEGFQGVKHFIYKEQ